MEQISIKQFQSVSIILPSGVSSGSFSVSVVDDGDILDLSVDWPKSLSNATVMHRKCIGKPILQGGFEAYHRKVIGFENALKKLRSDRLSKLSSVCRIVLPYRVLTKIINKTNLAFRDSENGSDSSQNYTLMLYVELESVGSNYSNQNDVDSFIVV